MDIQFRSDLPPARRRTSYDDFSKVLKENPGKWGAVPRKEGSSQKSSYTLASNINHDKVRALPSADFEARTVDGVTWVRYISSPTVFSE